MSGARRTPSAPLQGSLPGFEPPPKPTDRLFLGLFPDAGDAARLSQQAHGLRERFGLTGHLLAPERLHVTLHHLGDHVGLREDIVSAARNAADTVHLPPMEIAFDQVMSFATHSGTHPLVLCAGQPHEALRQLWQTLDLALQRAACPKPRSGSFTPHMTLLYDRETMPVQAVEPLAWTAREFVLVHSLLGQTRHIVLGRWPLR